MNNGINDVRKLNNRDLYREYLVALRYDTDSDLIEAVERINKEGISTLEIFKAGIKAVKEL